MLDMDLESFTSQGEDANLSDPSPLRVAVAEVTVFLLMSLSLSLLAVSVMFFYPLLWMFY